MDYGTFDTTKSGGSDKNSEGKRKTEVRLDRPMRSPREEQQQQTTRADTDSKRSTEGTGEWIDKPGRFEVYFGIQDIGHLEFDCEAKQFFRIGYKKTLSRKDRFDLKTKIPFEFYYDFWIYKKQLWKRKVIARRGRSTYLSNSGYRLRRFKFLISVIKMKRRLRKAGYLVVGCQGCGESVAKYKIQDPNKGHTEYLYCCQECVHFYHWKNKLLLIDFDESKRKGEVVCKTYDRMKKENKLEKFYRM